VKLANVQPGGVAFWQTEAPLASQVVRLAPRQVFIGEHELANADIGDRRFSANIPFAITAAELN
jgi:hypothetical protein